MRIRINSIFLLQLGESSKIFIPHGYKYELLYICLPAKELGLKNDNLSKGAFCCQILCRKIRMPSLKNARSANCKCMVVKVRDNRKYLATEYVLPELF